MHSPGLIPSVPSAGATVTAAQAEREMNVNTRCGAAGSLARVVAMDSLNAADPDTMSATTRPRLTPHPHPHPTIHRPLSLSRSLRYIPAIVLFIVTYEGGGGGGLSSHT